MIRDRQEDSTGIIRKLFLAAFTPGELRHFRDGRPNIRPDLAEPDVTPGNHPWPHPSKLQSCPTAPCTQEGILH